MIRTWKTNMLQVQMYEKFIFCDHVIGEFMAWSKIKLADVCHLWLSREYLRPNLMFLFTRSFSAAIFYTRNSQVKKKIKNLFNIWAAKILSRIIHNRAVNQRGDELELLTYGLKHILPPPIPDQKLIATIAVHLNAAIDEAELIVFFFSIKSNKNPIIVSVRSWVYAPPPGHEIHYLWLESFMLHLWSNIQHVFFFCPIL